MSANDSSLLAKESAVWQAEDAHIVVVPVKCIEMSNS